MDKLTNIIRTEFTFPVIKGKINNSSNQYIRLIPEGSDQTELAAHSEQRDFNINIQYVTQRREEDERFIDHMAGQASRFEALIHDNITMTLADSTTAFHCHLPSQEFDVEIEDMEDKYIIQWDFVCSHVGNTA